MMVRFTIFFLFLATLFSSCATNIVTMSVKEPAPVWIPKNILSAGIVNRTATSKANNVMNKIDEVLSGEGWTLDSLGALACIQGVYDELIQGQRFEATKLLDTIKLVNPTVVGMPSLLDWAEVARICETNRVDILFVLERFDTDTKIDYAVVPITIKTPLGIELPGVEHHATVSTVIETAWRIYDPITKIVYDEFPGSRRFISVGKGINPTVALQAVTNRNDLVKQNSNEIGHLYAQRTFHHWIRVSRDYYVNGSSNLQIAKRRAQTGNWDGAAELWLKDTQSSKRKVAGRACYNMAISSEINDDLDKAIEWAQKSYEDYNNRLALDYVRILRNRKANQARIEN